jgi:cyclic beta-1,2-glucan synthetase
MAQPELLRLLPTLTPPLAALLEGGRGLLASPIRAEIFGTERFEQHGRSLGLTHRAARGSWRSPTFRPRLNDNIAVLREAQRSIGAYATRGYDLSPAAEWLLDNFHLVEAQLQEIHDGLPRRYFRSLPLLQDPPLAGLPRVYGLAWAFVAHTDGAFEEDLLVAFLCAYQTTRDLSLGELWALPTTLRIVLIESLRRLAERVAANKAAREAANLCCDRLAELPVEALQRLLGLLEQRGVERVFLSQMALRLQEPAPFDGDDPVLVQRAWLSIALPDPVAAMAQHSADQAADNLSVSNALTALREIGGADWADIIARGSALMQLMLDAPPFAAEHVATRGQALHGIESLARRSGRSEKVVARTLLGCMRGSGAREAATAGYWLEGAGWPVLRQALGLHDGLALARGRLARQLSLAAYLGTLLAATGFLAATATGLQTGPAWALAFVLAAFPASEAVLAVMHRLIGESVRPQPLPRLALTEGIPAAHRVLVAIPAMLSDDAAVRALAHRLLLHHLANVEPEAQFALLTDWADADAPQAPADAALLALAVAQIEALNRQHGRGDHAPARFILLHRERQFSETEQRWIGWERKRGKLEQLMALLAGGDAGAFVDLGALSRPAPDTRHVVTLDSDTQLPPGQLRALVGVAAHPRNRPRLDATGRQVQGGFGILQPRIVAPLPASEHLTPFHWLFAGQCGVDPYSAASSEVYQDVFGAGSFSGKGLLDVQAMHAVLGGRLPEGRVLSHDLLEGALVRCGTVTDVFFIEEAPADADVAASRAHRWMRGDWQLLPFLATPGLRLLDRWKMLDNLRRSLLAPAALLLLLLALAGRAGTPGAVLALVFAAYAAGPLMGALAGLLPDRVDVAKRHFFSQALADLARALAGGLWHLALLPRQALAAADAVLRTLHRLAVSRRHLLAWTTAAAAGARGQATLATQWRRQAGTALPALALPGALLLTTAPAGAVLAGGLLGALWAATPLWTWWASRPLAARSVAVIPAADRAWLEELAHDTWGLFERCVVADENHLPPDNLQTLPHDEVAHRTSPTNIGMYLLGAACARRFGWIDATNLATRLEATLATLDRLPRHRGHFLNWYDTQTLATLLPAYVSTVDSGNLSGHLLAVAAACRETLPADAALAARLLALAERCETLAWAPEYGFLYHRKRHLLHIGYRVADQQLDASCYDLLASESRLTSLVAIAKGDVPVRHWAALGRPSVAVGGTAGLRSWSGSMFEYLMPGLVMDEPAGSVLSDASRAAVAEQRAFGAAQGLPWGVSESAHAGRDHTLAYQYAPQGVPGLALRRTPPEELVVAPYATVLAAPVALLPVLANLKLLAALGARGPYGYIEALDYSPGRQTLGSRFTPVSTFMAHHQGMSLVALANVLLDGAPRRWGMAAPRLEALAPLLHERPPRQVSRRRVPWGAPAGLALAPRAPVQRREVWPGAAVPAPTHVLSNGHYSVTLRANGAGESRWRGRGLSRWRDDALRDACGSFMFLRREASERRVSLTQHPAPDREAEYRSVFHADRVCLDARWPDLHTQTTVWVSPEDDIEFRAVELRNLGSEPIELELVSTFEPTLAEARADEAHPAFSNLFLRARWRAAHQALVFERRPRLAGEPALWAAHFIAGSDTPLHTVQVQTDRARWLGRHRPAHRPLGELITPPEVTGPTGAELDTGLDPMCALAVRLRLPPLGKAVLTFATAASDNAGVLSAVIDKYRQTSHVQRASLMSATLTDIRLRGLGIGAETFAAVQSLTTAMLLTLTRGPAVPATPAIDRRGLWRYGLSGERPILLVSVRTAQDIGLLRALGMALRIWAWGGVACDLVVVNSEQTSYQTPLQQAVAALPDPGAGLHRLRAEDLPPDTWRALRRLARVHLHADGRPLAHHVQEWIDGHERALDRRHAVSTTVVGSAAQREPLESVPTGRFDSASGDFQFAVNVRTRPARPWVNVLANPGFGSLLSESGGGHTWAHNSRMHQLTAWSNDPVADVPAEWFLLQDQRNGETWSLAPSAWSDARVAYEVVHGQGESVIRHRRGDLAVRTAWCVDPDLALKQVRVQLTNHGLRTVVLRVVGLVEWMLGEKRADRATVVAAEAAVGGRTVLLATQCEHAAGFGGATAFLALAAPAGESADWTCDRRECFDARGRLVLPDHFGQQQGGGLDPCAAIATRITLAPGASLEVVFLLGHADSRDEAVALALHGALQAAHARTAAVRAHWDELLRATTVQTPDPLFDVLVNRWLLYQAVACRLWAKAGFYQAGGATGFRDQLQDTLALAWAAPGLLRAQIVRCAGRQFAAGDVQHWWHAPSGAGVRTHVSDDLLWLPLAVVQHQRATGDATLLDEAVPFLDGGEIPPGAEDLYETPRIGDESASVYEHAARAIDRSLHSGPHGLPLIGGGDWNDGMNRVGHGGRGESVWLAWFLCVVVDGYAPLALARGEHERALAWQRAVQGWRGALEAEGWDGAWYRRAFFDDGSALGSAANPEARIDLIAQAWAVLSGAAPPPRQRAAMDAVQQHLVDDGLGLLRLLDPPLDQARPEAGYIQAYPGGVRENGGQYAHAGVWALMARARLAGGTGALPGDRDAVYEWFTFLSPAHRSAHPVRGPLYGLEPYAMAGDVCSQPPHAGRGGWSWYTGAAAWLHRAAVEALFGLRLEAQTLSFRPCLPTHWPRASLTLRREGRTLHFSFVQGEQRAEPGVTVLQPGAALAWRALPAEASFVVPIAPEGR